ncbi:MAG: sugar phosphate isomerase/epimerase [Clostridia bacterium]|nr:sugar phosphate isomerase/epimerase [Clostridia bacterium]MBR5383193.1 sugar phosphate isomerase/epimerase [Clostridia bacterium]
MIISIHPGNLFERYGIEDGFRLMHDNGIEGIQFGLSRIAMKKEIVVSGKPCIMDRPLDEIFELVRPYKEASKKYGVIVSQVHAPYPEWIYGRPDVYERMQEVLKKSIAITEYMESPFCIIHPPCDGDAFAIHTYEEEWEVCRKVYEPLIPYLKKHHVMALLENMFNRGVEGERYAAACSDFQEAARWVDKLNEIAGEECFGFNFDSGHCFLARQNLYRSMTILGKRIKALHLADNNGHIDDHLLPYTGQEPWENVIQALIDIGYDGDLNYEVQKGLSAFPKELEDIAMRMQARIGCYMRDRIRVTKE